VRCRWPSVGRPHLLWRPRGGERGELAPRLGRPDLSGHAERGQRGDAMIVWCILLAVLLLPLGGLTIDLWRGIAAQRSLQSAAEDAATAGSSGIDVQQYRATGCLLLDPVDAVPLAQANLASQADLGPLAAVDISVTPDDRQISVTLEEDVHLTLLSLVEGDRPLVVTATATSAPEGSVQGNGCS
jgi:Flp pilus assembly protein TadG